MKRMTVAFFVVFLLAGCSLGNSDEADRDKETIKALTARVEKLEKETNALRKGLAEALGGIAAIEKGLARLDGAGIAEKTLPAPKDDTDEEVTKDELDSKARQFANESLERLLDISRSVLDRIEQELDKIEEPPMNEEAPKTEEKTL